MTAALAIDGSIGLSLVTACLFGLSIPSLLHSLKLDPKIAAGPVTLAITDFVARVLPWLAVLSRRSLSTRRSFTRRLVGIDGSFSKGSVGESRWSSIQKMSSEKCKK
jgi:hypothetical protein